MKNSPLTLLLLLLVNLVFAQGRYYQINFANSRNIDIVPRTGTVDSAGFILEVQKIKNQFLSDGHLLANVDQLQISEDSMLAVINVGEKYNWSSLGTRNIPEEMLSRVGYRVRDFAGKEFSSREFNRLITNILNEAANTGYPFANLQMQNIEVLKNSVKGVLEYEPGPVIYYDSLTVSPQNFIKHKFLENYLRTREGTLFQLKNIDEIENSINRLPYCQLKDSLQLSFENNLCNIGFQLKPVKANKIDALIGFLPNQKRGDGLLLTGYINLQLQNLFKSGKELSFVWRQFQEQSQKLFVLYKHPNIFNSPLGISLNFDLLKQDSTFLNTNFNIAGYYQFRKMEVSFTTLFKSSRTLSTPKDSLILPQVADFNIQQLGMRAAYNSLGNITNPRRGALAFVDVQIGNKQIKKTPEIAEVVYDSISLKSIQFEATIGGEVNHQLLGFLVAHVDFALGTILNNDILFTNDLKRLGGVNSLRGFNDLELFVSSYAYARFEARLLLNSNSRLFLFYDQGFTNNVVTNITDQPRGFGAGMMLDTGKGDLQLVYALGVSGQQSLSLTQAKIHIGYVARF